jgi:MarR family transcriptional regulator, lower aerobic nicotinate degradation pathway regulator
LSSRGEDPAADLQELYRRPGFLLRRAHQISVALFLEEMSSLGVTASQYGLMFILRARPGLEQIGLSRLIGLDRSTTALVLRKLETDGLIVRRPGSIDRRRKELALTAKGHALLNRLAEPAKRAQKKVLAPFTAAERDQFLALLTKFVDAYNEVVRAPLTPE